MADEGTSQNRSPRTLANKPLVEAIFEARWKLASPSPGLKVDPHSRLLLGRFYDRMVSHYPIHVQLDSANVPEGMLPHVAQHQFRIARDSWPLIQIGPGLLTVNDTETYTWPDFRSRCEQAMDCLRQAYPEPLSFSHLMLRYIDAVVFDYEKENVLDFIRDKLKFNVACPSELFQGTGVRSNPLNFSTQVSFLASKPSGAIQLSFATGVRDGKPALIWETVVHSIGSDLPPLPDGFGDWIQQAHELANDWFFKMIAGDLERSFQ